jgi:hypothetical protein
MKRFWLAAVLIAVSIPACAADGEVFLVRSESDKVVQPKPFQGYEEKAKREKLYEDLFSRKQFAALDDLAQRMRRDRSFLDPTEWDLDQFYKSLTDSSAKMSESEAVARTQEWIRDRPASPTPRVLLVEILYRAAWKRRGGGYTDTVTRSGRSQYEALMTHAERFHREARAVAEKDPQYQAQEIELAQEMGTGDGRQIARQAAKWTQYPSLYYDELMYLRERWGGNPAEARAWIEEAARLTRPSLRDGMYAYLAYQSLFKMDATERARMALDPVRARDGCRDMIAAGPAWTTAYHRCARLARASGDRQTLRELFKRPELAWFEGVEGVWGKRTNYDEARIWARSDPRLSGHSSP